MPDVAGLIDRLAAAWEHDIGPEYQANACILASRTGAEVLRYFGVAAEPRPVGCIVTNAEGWTLIGQDVPIEQWPETAWSVGAGVGPHTNNGYSGHMMIYVPGECWLDLTFGQFDRPSKGINCPPVLAVEPDGTEDTWDVRRAWRHAVVSPGTHLMWGDHADTHYRTAPDWRWKYRPLAARIIRTLKEDDSC